MGEIYGYIGTYASNQSRGVYRFALDTDSGKMTEPELIVEAEDAKWVSLCKDRLVFPARKGGCAGVCAAELTDEGWKPAGESLEETDPPCYILQDDGYVFTASYHQGTVMVYKAGGGQITVCRRIEAGREAGCHQILLHENYLMVPCLTQHCIRMYDMEQDYIPAGVITFPGGSGPRHGVFNKGHERLYVVSEWSNELFIFTVRGTQFNLICQAPVIQGDAGDPRSADCGKGRPASAAIRLTKDEKFLYVSVRGLDLIAAFCVDADKVIPVQYIPCGGEHPRDFILTGDERFLIVANRYSGGIVSIARDKVSGELSQTVSRIQMPQGVSLCLSK